jgi:hypothetical protein
LKSTLKAWPQSKDVDLPPIIQKRGRKS